MRLSLLALSALGANAFAPSALPVRRVHSTTVSAVPKSDSYKITLLPGDGIGPEITDATVAALEAVGKAKGITFDFDTQLIGGSAIDATGGPWPAATLESCQKADSILLAAIGGPKWDSVAREIRPESGLLAMRKQLGLFANLRPAKSIPQLLDASSLKREVVEGVDIMVVRELTGDVYFGEPKGIDVDADGKRTGYNNMIYSDYEVSRIAKVAFDIAGKRGNKVCSIDKANVLDVSQLWRDVVIEEHAAFPDVELSHMYVDNCAMQLVRWPKQFDTIVCGNIFGDILSDEASMLVGSLGMLPSASIGTSGPGVFEPIHGSAPDIAGTDKANPLAMILSAAMMLRYDLAQPEAAQMLEDAVEAVLDDNVRTVDIVGDTKGAEVVGCKVMGEKVVAALAAM